MLELRKDITIVVADQTLIAILVNGDVVGFINNNNRNLIKKPAAKKTTKGVICGAFTRAYNASRKLWKKHDTAKRNQVLLDAGFYAPWYKTPMHA